jgi:hypothetical protein
MNTCPARESESAGGSLTGDLAISCCLAKLASLGYSDATLIAAGMEGVVFRLNEQLVAKLWPGASARQIEILSRLQAFYRALARHHLPFMTPQIYEIVSLDDTTVTIELALPGVQLRSNTTKAGRGVQRSTMDCLTTVLQGTRVRWMFSGPDRVTRPWGNRTNGARRSVME